MDQPVKSVTLYSFGSHFNSKIHPLLFRIAETSDGFTVESLVQDIAEGNFVLWSIHDFKAIALTMLQVRPTQKVLFVPWLAGADMDDWVEDWLEHLKNHAKEAGADAVEFFGRPGYEKYKALRERYPATILRNVYRMEV